MSDLSHSTSARAAARGWPLAMPLLLGALGLAGAALIVRAALAMLPLLSYPYPNDGLEGTLLYEARLLWAGEPLYQPLERYRFVSAPYPPLHPLVLGAADLIAGPHVFWGGRLVSFVAALVVGALIVLIVRRASGSWLGGLVASALFLSAPPTILWATRIKPDLFALVWTTLGLYLASRALGSTTTAERRGRLAGLGWPVAAALCFVLAFFTRQTAVAAPLAAGLALLASDLGARWAGTAARSNPPAGFVGALPLRWRTLVYGVAYLGLVLELWGLLDLLLGGQYTAHVWGLHRSEWWSWSLMRKFVVLLLPYIPLALVTLGLMTRALRDDRALVPLCYALVAPITLFGSGESGANHNHLLETLLGLSIAGGTLLGWAARVRPTPLVAAVLVLMTLQVGLAFRPQEWYLGELEPQDSPERFVAFMRATPGEILADDIGLLMVAGKPIRYDDPSTMGLAAESMVWDQGGLIDDIANRRFSAIMIPVDVEREPWDHARRWNAAVMAAIHEHYQIKFRDRIMTYVPRS